MGSGEGRTRRELLRDAGAAGAGAMVATSTSPLGIDRDAPRAKRREVAILGGGHGGPRRGARGRRARLQGHRLRARPPWRQGAQHPGPGDGRRAAAPSAGRARLPLLPRLLPPRPRHDAPDPVRGERERRARQPRRRHRGALGARERRAGHARPRDRSTRRTSILTVEGLRHILVQDLRPGRGAEPGGDRVLRQPPARLPHQLRRAPLRPVGARDLVGLRRRRGHAPRSTRRSSRAASPARSSPPRSRSPAPARSGTWARRSS